MDKEEGQRRIKTYEDREHIGQNFPVLSLHTPLSTFLPCLLSSCIKPNCKKPTPVSNPLPASEEGAINVSNNYLNPSIFALKYR